MFTASFFSEFTAKLLSVFTACSSCEYTVGSFSRVHSWLQSMLKAGSYQCLKLAPSPEFTASFPLLIHSWLLLWVHSWIRLKSSQLALSQSSQLAPTNGYSWLLSMFKASSYQVSQLALISVHSWLLFLFTAGCFSEFTASIQSKLPSLSKVVATKAALPVEGDSCLTCSSCQEFDCLSHHSLHF